MNRNHGKTPFPVDTAGRMRPRDPVFMALKARVLSGGGAGRHRSPGRRRDAEDRDLADRIREVGEW